MSMFTGSSLWCFSLTHSDWTSNVLRSLSSLAFAVWLPGDLCWVLILRLKCNDLEKIDITQKWLADINRSDSNEEWKQDLKKKKRKNLEQESEWLKIEQRGSKNWENSCLMDIGGCELLSVSDARGRWAVVPAGLFLLIFPCSLCWLMGNICSEAEKRCGLNLVTRRPVLSPCCALALCLSFCLIPFCSLRPYFLVPHTVCLHLSSLPHIFSPNSPSPLSILITHLLEPLQGRVLDLFNIGEDLMNALRTTLRWLSSWKTFPVSGRPLIINFDVMSLDHCRPVLMWPHVNLTDHRSQAQQPPPGFTGWCGLGCSVSSTAARPPRTNMARSKIKPPRVLQRPCGKAIKWSYRGHNGDEIFNGLHRERDK